MTLSLADLIKNYGGKWEAIGSSAVARLLFTKDCEAGKRGAFGKRLTGVAGDKNRRLLRKNPCRGMCGLGTGRQAEKHI